MNTIEIILGNNPFNQSVDDEFYSRNLSLEWFNETITTHNIESYSVSGHYSTLSDNPDTAAKKLLVIENEIETKESEIKNLGPE